MGGHTLVLHDSHVFLFISVSFLVILKTPFAIECPTEFFIESQRVFLQTVITQTLVIVVQVGLPFPSSCVT